jgi:hypothetical protein
MVLFRATNVGALGVEMHAILTPSTKGLRENIASQGISFSMPLMPKGSSATATTAANLADETSNREKNTTKESSVAEKLNDSNSNSISSEIKSSGNLFRELIQYLKKKKKRKSIKIPCHG